MKAPAKIHTESKIERHMIAWSNEKNQLFDTTYIRRDVVKKAMDETQSILYDNTGYYCGDAELDEILNEAIENADKD